MRAFSISFNGSQPTFKIFQADTGTSPTASSPTDTITFTGAGGITVGGNAATKTITITGSGGGTPAGSTKQIQYNNAGSFGADSLFVWDFTNHRLGVGLTTPTSIFHVVGDSFLTANLTTQKGLVVKGKASSSVTTFEVQSSSGTDLIDIGNDNKFHIRTNCIFHNVVGGSILALTSGNDVQGINTLTNLVYSPGANALTAVPSGSSGYIQFRNVSGLFDGVSDLFWDATNKRLGIGTSSPAQALDVKGEGLFTGATVTTTAATSMNSAFDYSSAGTFSTSNYTADGTTQRGYQLYTKRLDYAGNPFYSATNVNVGPLIDNNNQLTISPITSVTAVQADGSGSYGPANGTTSVAYQIYSRETVNGVTIVSSTYNSTSVSDNGDTNNYGVQLNWTDTTFNASATAKGYYLIRNVSGAGYNDYLDLAGPGTNYLDDGTTNWNIGTLPTLTPTSTPDFYQIDLGWTPSVDSSASGYRLYYSPNNFSAIPTGTPTSPTSNQVDGTGSYVATGVNYQYQIYAYQVISGVTVYSSSSAYLNISDNNDANNFTWDLAWTDPSFSPYSGSHGYIVQRNISSLGFLDYKDVGSSNFLNDDGTGWVIGTPTLTPTTGVASGYTDISGVSTSSFVDTSSISYTNAATPPTPTSQPGATVEVTPTLDGAININSNYQFPRTAPPAAGYVLKSTGTTDNVMAWANFNLSAIPGQVSASQIAFSSNPGNIVTYDGSNINSSVGFTCDLGSLFQTLRCPTFLAFGSGLQLGPTASAGYWQMYANGGDFSFYNIHNGYGIVMAITDDSAVDIRFPKSHVKLTQAGKGLFIKEGTNAKMGLATLAAGTVVVATTAVTANSRIFLTAQTLGTITVPVGLYVSARTAGTSFTILSGNLVDTSTVAWFIVEPS